MVGIANCFQKIFHSGNSAHPKPTQEFFSEVVEYLGLEFYQCHLIDDNCSAISTAMNLGMRVTDAKKMLMEIRR
jgi:HAD superfamily hydrolase (TIGR01509 family)